MYVKFCTWVYLCIITTIAGKWLNNLIFHDNVKCIIANGHTIIYVGTDYTCHATIIHFMHCILSASLP